jgi:hypothetical protein
MSSSLILDRDVDLYLSMTWPKSPNKRHGVCGHMYEIIDYYLLLKCKYNIKILIGEQLLYDYELVIRDKYDLSDQDVFDIIKNTTFVDRPKILIGNNILFVDGLLKTHFQNGGVRLMFKNIFTFRCSPRSNHQNLHYKNVTLLQDNRAYSDDNDISIQYVKKIYFDKLKPVNFHPDVALIYGTGNCRLLDIQTIIDIVKQYNFKKYLLVTDVDMDISSPVVDVIKPPIRNIFNKFGTYIYTPTQKSFDCSSRLIAECAFFGKHVIYHDITEEYLTVDTGLSVRINDVTNGIDCITLTEHDEIFNILDEKL